jgi:hypothetical protein
VPGASGEAWAAQDEAVVITEGLGTGNLQAVPALFRPKFT